MQVMLEGNFVKNSQVKKKDGTILNVAIVLAGDETVQVNNMAFSPDVKPLQPVKLKVNVKSTQYGLMVTPVTDE